MPDGLYFQLRELESDQPTYWLFELEVPTDPPTRYRLTNADDDVTFMEDSEGNPLTYSRFPVAHDGLPEDGAGGIPTITFNVHNASLELKQTIWDNGGFTGQPVVIRIVNQAELDDANAQIRVDAKVVGLKVTESTIALSVSAANLYDRFFPRRRYQALRCRVRNFGDAECGYPIEHPSAAFTDCPRTLEACDARGDDELTLTGEKRHPRRFNAERGLFRGPR